MANVLFLDIDGVLNSDFWNNNHKKEISNGTLIDKEKVKLLASLVKRTNAKIILHSGWRAWFDFELKPLRTEAERLTKFIENEGLHIDGVTPDLTTEELRKTRKFSLVKADEILLWLESHNDVTGWVVLDDLDLHNIQAAQHQVRPDPAVGLTDRDVEEAVRLLWNQHKKLKVALIQYNAAIPDIEQNTITAKKLIREASKNGADLVLFPECFLTAYAPPHICEKLLPVQEIENCPEFIKWCENALTEQDEHFIQIANLAAELQTGVIITGFSKGKKYPQNTAWVIDRDGKVILKYSKVHTCDFDWERYLESGASFPVCRFDGITIGCMICYDREYPESARELMLNGAELIMHPNCCGGMYPRLKELSVRAMENMVGIAMANPPAQGMGNSCAFNPMVWTQEGMDNTIFIGSELEETIYYVEFDIDEIRAYRKSEDLGKYRKTQAYKKLV